MADVFLFDLDRDGSLDMAIIGDPVDGAYGADSDLQALQDAVCQDALVVAASAEEGSEFRKEMMIILTDGQPYGSTEEKALSFPDYYVEASEKGITFPDYYVEAGEKGITFPDYYVEAGEKGITFPDYYVEVGEKGITFPDYIDYIERDGDGPDGSLLAIMRPEIDWDFNGAAGDEGAETWAHEDDALIFLIG